MTDVTERVYHHKDIYPNHNLDQAIICAGLNSIYKDLDNEYSNYNSNNYDCDCSIVGMGSAFEVIGAGNADRLQCNAVHYEALSEDHVLMYVPTGQHGVIVVRRDAFHIWNLFHQPRDWADIKNQLTDFECAVVKRMVTVGLLQPEGQEVKLTPLTKLEILTVWLHVTNQCNLRCDYCYIDKSPERMSEEVGIKAVDSAFRSAVQNGFKTVRLKFAGGEASLNPAMIFDLDTYAQFKARSLRLQYQGIILSNGVRISERLIEECKSRGLQWMISLDGLGEAHDRQRKLISGRSTAALVTQTIETMLSLGVRPSVRVTLTGRNSAYLAETVRFILERNLPFNIGFVRENMNVTDLADMRLLDHNMMKAMDEVFSVVESNIPKYSLLGGMLADQSNFLSPREHTCGMGLAYMVVDHHGHITKCQMEMDTSVTHIDAENPLKILREDTNGLVNVSVEEKEGCRACEWRYGCSGGCPKLTYQATGRNDVKSPYCNIYKDIYPKLMRLEGLRILKYYSPCDE